MSKGNHVMTKDLLYLQERPINLGKHEMAIKKRMSKSRFLAVLAQKSGLDASQATAALDTINAIVTQQLGKRGPGEILIPGLLKLSVVEKPATGQYEGIHPFTREPMTYKARAARKVIRVRPLKSLMDAI